MTAERDAPAGDDEPPEDPGASVEARYQGWTDRAPDPRLPLQEYAAIAAELAEEREPRTAVLLRHDLDEDAWTLEERAWLERIGNAAMEGDTSLALAYGDRFVAAQDALGAPGEQARSLDDYLAIRVAMEAAEDPCAALRDRSLTLSVWMRLDRRFARARAADPALGDEMERRLATLRGKVTP
jgi:hypothetical protein